MQISIRRGQRHFPDALTALLAPAMAGDAGLRVCAGTGEYARELTREELHAAVTAAEQDGRAPHGHVPVLRAVLAAWDAAEDGPTPPPFALPPFPEEERAALAADLRARLYLPLTPGMHGDLTRLHNLRNTASVPPRPLDHTTYTHLLHYTWTEAAGYPAHCAGWPGTSERPYRPEDRCDGQRDDEAFYLLFFYLNELGLTWEDGRRFHDQAYPQDIAQGGFRIPLVWYAAAWRAQVSTPALTVTTFQALTESLYDMNHRSLEEVLSREVLPLVAARSSAAGLAAAS